MTPKPSDGSEDRELDLELIPSETDDYIASPSEYEIATYPADYTLSGLYEMWKQGDIQIPKFQRQFVWKQVQAAKLIESFLVGLPVPAIFLYTERKSQKFLVIDGQQRLKSIFYFFDGYFSEDDQENRKVFRLKALSEFTGTLLVTVLALKFKFKEVGAQWIPLSAVCFHQIYICLKAVIWGE